jgi:antirestriction protein ArdC
LLRYYNVFNATQIDGLESLKLGNGAQPVPNIEACDALVAGMPNPPKFVDSNAAWYRSSVDTIGMPLKAGFDSAEEYYSTLFHEMTHSTGHVSRIGREGIENLNAFGSESYSREELIAELGASMLCGTTGISPATLQNSASYLQSWITRLKGDSKLILSAASAAQKAADYIRGTQTEQTEGGNQ